MEMPFQAGFQDTAVVCVAVYMQAEIPAHSPGENNSGIERELQLCNQDPT